MKVRLQDLHAETLLKVLDGLGWGYAWFDPDLYLLARNDAFLRVNELPADRVTLKMPLQELIRFHAERGDYGKGDVTVLIDRQLSACRTGEPSLSERTTPDGCVVRVTLLPLADCGVLQLCEDVTNAHRTERLLHQSEERYDFAMRAINEGVYDWDITTDAIFYSERVHHAVGLEPGSLKTTYDWSARVHPDDLTVYQGAIIAHLKGETERLECDYRFRAQNGSWRWARQHGLALRDELGHAYRMIGSTGDITELKQAELELDRTREALEEQNRQLQAEIEAHRRSQATIEYLVDEIRSDHSFGEIIGRSPAFKHLTAQMELVAETDATVLILGETGTGKELVARTVHELSRRRDKPLIKVNCAALPHDLVESELFGHEKGAFTGATQLRRGRFELADSGSLFLDEVGELPLEAQAKLLRVLQEQEFERVGGSRSLRTDVRLMAATNQDLRRLVDRGQFRSDLYYRLNVFPLFIPPLRERREDIPLLIQHFLKRISRKIGKSLDGEAADFLDHAQRYDWPGNIRELENAVERAAILSQNGSLQLCEPLIMPMKATPTTAETRMLVAGQRLEEVERTHIQQVLSQTAGVIEGPHGAARVLGLKPSTLRARLRKLGIKRPSRS